MLLINIYFFNPTFACFPDVEELIRKSKKLQEELALLEKAVERKRIQLEEMREELSEYSKLKSAIPSSF